MNRATLSLAFSCQIGNTSLRVVRQDPPWRAIRAFPNESGEALVHLHNVSGGVLGGDSLRLEATLAPQSKAQITTVGATRVHRHREGWPDAHHVTQFQIGAGALLEYLPEPVIPFARSRFIQDCEIHLAQDAGLIWWEAVAAGRLAHGERFHFDCLSVATAIHSPAGPIALERYCVSPGSHCMESPARMGPFSYSATMYVCRADDSPRWLALERELNTVAEALSGVETCWGASALVRQGIVIRGLARRAHQVEEGLRSFWQAAKRSVWESQAHLPRKVL